MPAERQPNGALRPRFVIDGLARSGSTALARILPVCADLNCLIEPFHPLRYNGRYRKAVKDAASLRSILELLWLRWSGIKHIWVPPEGFPFAGQPELNDEIVRCATCVIFMRRRNYLRRYVSSMLSRRLRFWIGRKEEYRHRLDESGFPIISPETARKAIAAERLAVEQRESFLIRSRIRHISVYYEDLFGETVSASAQVDQINRILWFLCYPSVDYAVSGMAAWKEIMSRSCCKWNTSEVYRRIPNVRALEAAVGSQENGWLFS